MTANHLLKKMFLYNAGHTYSNLSRLFLRLFTGVMFLQLCIRQMLHFDEIVPTEGSMSLLLVVELLCATFIIVGLLTRLAVLPPMVIMCIAEELLLSSSSHGAVQLFSFQPGYPVMFLGVFCFILLAGPGKISLDYIVAVHLIDNKEDNETLEKA